MNKLSTFSELSLRYIELPERSLLENGSLNKTHGLLEGNIQSKVCDIVFPQYRYSKCLLRLKMLGLEYQVIGPIVENSV